MSNGRARYIYISYIKIYKSDDNDKIMERWHNWSKILSRNTWKTKTKKKKTFQNVYNIHADPISSDKDL